MSRLKPGNCISFSRGHSKGGNLAAWAAIHLPERLQKSRLDMAYNNDGPGFNRDMVDTPEYRRVAHKLKTFIPEESIVGVLLEHSEDYYVIASNNRGILQHESLSWQTMANHFVYLDARSGMGKMSDELVRQWVNSMTPEEREKFCDAFFDVLSMEGKVSSLDQLEKEGLAGKAALLKQFIGADEEKRRILTDMFRRLAAVQFQSRGWPLWGDGKYSTDGNAPIALFSCTLAFRHPEDGKAMRFTAIPPEIAPWDLFSPCRICSERMPAAALLRA